MPTPKITYSEIEEDESKLEDALPCEKAAWAVIRELYGRAAFDHWWDGIADADKDELFEELSQRIAEQYN